jgi:hypothetical protein
MGPVWLRWKRDGLRVYDSGWPGLLWSRLHTFFLHSPNRRKPPSGPNRCRARVSSPCTRRPPALHRRFIRICTTSPPSELRWELQQIPGVLGVGWVTHLRCLQCYLDSMVEMPGTDWGHVSCWIVFLGLFSSWCRLPLSMYAYDCWHISS